MPLSIKNVSTYVNNCEVMCSSGWICKSYLDNRAILCCMLNCLKKRTRLVSNKVSKAYEFAFT